MFKNIPLLPDDPILKLSRLCREDARSGKIDVGVGIYQNALGETPIMAAVKAAEERVWQQQTTKKYLGMAGNERFNAALSELVLGPALDANRTRGNQSVAGTGALRLIAETLRNLLGSCRVHVPDPTWGNHVAIFEAAGHAIQKYPYYDSERAALRREEFFAAMRAIPAGEIVILHGCCHNPSGEDLSPEDWQQLAQIAQERGFLPVVDLAYLGFGEGIEQDGFGVRHLAQNLPYLLIAASCSKNFGLYRERAGAVISIAPTAPQADALHSQFNAASRAMISMPADHGAAVVAEILSHDDLRQSWAQELATMRQAIRERRGQLAEALRTATGRDWSFVTRHKGMFSLLPLGSERVLRLREEQAVYMVGTGRINIAGLRSAEAAQSLAQRIAAVSP